MNDRMKIKNKLLIIVLFTITLFASMQIIKYINYKNYVEFATHFTNELSLKYGIEYPEFTIWTEDGQSYWGKEGLINNDYF